MLVSVASSWNLRSVCSASPSVLRLCRCLCLCLSLFSQISSVLLSTLSVHLENSIKMPLRLSFNLSRPGLLNPSWSAILQRSTPSRVLLICESSATPTGVRATVIGGQHRHQDQHLLWPTLTPSFVCLGCYPAATTATCNLPHLNFKTSCEQRFENDFVTLIN